MGNILELLILIIYIMSRETETINMDIGILVSITNYHKFSGLNLHKFIILNF